jgi:two-component system, repressor protein LuxO
MIDQPAPASSLNVLPPALAASGPAPKRSPRELAVLLVEDDHEIADMYWLALRQAGIDVTVAYDGTSALQALTQRRYALVLLDLRLPDIDGLEVLDRIGADPAPERPRVVILSNYGEPSTMREGLRRGAAQFIIKSNLTPRELTHVVARWLLT